MHSFFALTVASCGSGDDKVNVPENVADLDNVSIFFAVILSLLTIFRLKQKPDSVIQTVYLLAGYLE